MWDEFIFGFCKVQFLCYAGEPNWLGWLVLVAGPPAVLFGLLIFAKVVQVLDRL